jgi:hypothetical protein
MENISTSTIKEIKLAKEIVHEIRNFGVNDNIICMIVEQLALDLTDIALMKELRELAGRGSKMKELKDIGLKELEKVGMELTEKKEK